jgi:hypothetical protein
MLWSILLNFATDDSQVCNKGSIIASKISEKLNSGRFSALFVATISDES